MANKESQLNLRLTAQNDASGAFEALATTVSKIVDDIQSAARSASEAFQSISRAATETAPSVTNSLQDEAHAFTAVADSTRNLDDSLMSIETAISSVTMAVREQTMAMTTSKEETATLAGVIGEGGLLLGLQQVGQAMEGLGRKGDQLFTGAIQSAADFEANISRIHAVLMNREPTANMQEMADAALQLGSNSKFSANEIAQGMYDLARQGLSSTQILGDGVNGAIDVVNNLAQATDSSMSDTARIVTDVLHEYNLTGNQLSVVANMISGAMHSSSISMQDFYMSMKQVGPIASNMHQNVSDVSTAIALLAQHGITGSQAGTALKNMLLGLEPHTAKAAALMNELGISTKNGAADSFYQLDGTLKPLPDIIGILNDKFGGLDDAQKQAALSATFTKYGLAGLNVIATESKDKFNEFKKALSEENAADIAKEKMNNLQGDMLRLNAATATMSKSFGDTLEPAMRKVSQAALSVVQWFNHLSPSTKEVIMVVGGIVSAMATVGGAILSVVTTIGFLNMGLGALGIELGVLLGPIALVIAAIAAIGVAIFECYKHADEINAWFKSVFGVSIPQVMNALWQATKLVFGEIWNVIKQAWDGISQATKAAWDYIKPTIIGAVQDVSAFWKSVWPEIKELFTEVWNVMKVFLAPTVAALYVIISGALGLIKGAWHDAWNAIKDALKLAWDLITNVIKTAWDIISGLFKVALDLLTGHWSQAWTDMKSLLGNVWNDIKKLFSDFITDAMNFGHDLVMGIAHGIEGAIGAVVSAARNVVNAIKSIFSSAPTAPSGGNAMAQAAGAVPKFAEGGVVSQPTLALVGEGGEEEYIIPKSKLTQQSGYQVGLPSSVSMPGGASGSASGNGNVINQVFNISVNAKDGSDAGNQIMGVLRQQTKLAIR